jgi:integrase
MNTKLRYLVQTSDGLYRYQRKVPKKFRAVLRRDVWNYSLGREHETAIQKWQAHKETHDDLIARLKSGDPTATADAVTIRTADHLARMERIHKEGPKRSDPVVEATPEELEEAEEGNRQAVAGVQNLWSKTFDIMEDCEGSPQEYTRLVAHLAMGFGDQTYMRETVEMPEALRPVPPSGGGQKRMHDMMHTALLERLAEIAPNVMTKAEHTLSVLAKKYFALNNSSDATQRSYNNKIKQFDEFTGAKLPVDQITSERLRAYRDHLMKGGKKGPLSPDSVAQYFAPMKAIMRWVISEELVPGFDSMPTETIKMPKGGKTIEDSRWQRFDDNEIKQVWGLVQKAWGPDSKYTPERQEAFKWAFRVALYTAARPVEIFRMKPENVTPDFINVTETKTRISRKLPLSKHLKGFHEFMQDGGWKLGKTKPESVAGTMSDSFTKTIREAGFTNSRQVLYSCKDTLVDRLQRANCSDDVIRGITGHVSGQGQLRNYKTRLNDTPEGLEMLRNALDGITYW